MSDQEQDPIPNMSSWPLSDFDIDTQHKSNVNPSSNHNNINNDHLFHLLDFDIDNVEEIKEVQEQELLEGDDGDGGGNKKAMTTSSRKNQGKKVINKGKKVVINKEGGGSDEHHEIHIWTERERRKKMRIMFTDLHALLPHLPSKVDKSTIVDEAVNYIKILEPLLEKLEKQKEERLQLQQIHQSASSTFECPTSQWFQFPYENNNNNSVTENNNNKINGSNLVAAATTNTTENNTINNIIGTSSNNANNNNNNVNYNNNPGVVEFQTWSSPNVVLNTCGDIAQFSVCYPKELGFSTIYCVLHKYNIEVLSAHISSDNDRRLHMIHAQISGGSNQFPDAYSVVEIFKQAAAEMIMLLSA